MDTMTTLSLKEARERLRQTIEEYVRLDAELRQLEDTNYRVCIFGSARIRPKDPLYRQVFYIAQSLSERGIDVVTGGGPGLMAAANRGVLAAKRTRSTSYGLPLDLPTLVEPPNRHLDVKSAHKRFSSRLDEFIRLSHAVVVAPGGIGTLLELMYIWQLLQLDAVEPRPTILLGRGYWEGLLTWMREAPLAEGLVNPEDLDAVSLVDTPEEALRLLEANHAQFRVRAQQALLHPAAPQTAEAATELAEELELETEAREFALRELRRAA